MNVVLFSEFDIVPHGKNEYVFYKNDERYLHLKKILKLKTGDNFKAGLINQKMGIAKIIEFSDEKLIFYFTANIAPVPLPPITLILGFPRPIQLRRILRDCGSLGIAELYLTGTELGEKSYLKSTLSEKTEIEKYLIDGIAQAGQNLLPCFSFCNSVKHCLTVIDNFHYEKVKKIVLDIDEKAAALNFFTMNSDERVIVAIGSERGWTDNERLLFADKGFQPYSMGKRILRTETAVCSALSVISANNNLW